MKKVDLIFKKCPNAHKHYAAKLLFQYRIAVPKGRTINKMRPCAVITIVLNSSTPKKAIKIAKSEARKKEVTYKNSDNNIVFYEFVGIVEMIDISSIVNSNECWVWFGKKLTPMERKDEFVLTDEEILERIS